MSKIQHCALDIVLAVEDTSRILHGPRFTFIEFREQIEKLIANHFPEIKWRDASVDPPLVGQWCIVVIDGVVQTHSCRLAMQDDEYVWEWSDTDADCCPIDQVSHWQPWPEFQKEQKG